MAIVKFSPFSPWWNDRFFEDEDNWPATTVNEGLDVYETDDNVIVKAAVPGIPSDKVDVTFEDGVLRISGRVEENEEEKKKKKVVYKEQKVRSFDYTTTLPRAVKSEEIRADVEDGVVTVTAPIAGEAKARKISVAKK